MKTAEQRLPKPRHEMGKSIANSQEKLFGDNGKFHILLGAFDYIVVCISLTQT
jgi:hypothetical protein